MKTICLNNGWKLHDSDMRVVSPSQVKNEKERWYDCNVPCDVRMPLIENSVIKDPVLADYSFESEWIEDRAWWYFHEFDYLAEDYDAVELVIESLDTDSEIYLNDTHIGSHRNVHRPFVKDVAEFLQKGKNTLAVRVTTGLEKITNEEVLELDKACCTEASGSGCYDVHRGDYRRPFVRRAQYTIGWDWGPRVVTCGIVGNVKLECYKTIAVRELSIATKRADEKKALLSVCANIEVLDYFASKECDYELSLKKDGKLVASKATKEVFLTSGYNYIDFDIEVENPKLWWPNGYGEQSLYTIDFKAICDGNEDEYPEFSYGIRTVELDLNPIPENKGQNYFALKVNGVRVFCKGGDWIPSDSIYARVTTEKYETLVSEAVEANFNSFRLWGGGLYEREVFYDLCDKHGILLWHDFMFACATYPDHRESFREECRREMDYQTKRLRNRACIGLFCGNNENHEIFYARGDENSWDLTYTRNKQYGMYVSNVVAKEVIRANCSHIPYWPSSPYGGEMPASEDIGDVHYWNDGMMNKNMENRIDPFVYDKLTAKFVSEYGYIGPCSIESIKTYFDGKEIDRNSHIWKLHNNAFEKETVLAGINKHYPVDVNSLSLDDYITHAGAVHSLILGYSLEAIRFKENCHGAIFWMYNDTWGEVGWTIIDYYLRRKIGYYGVKRAFENQKLSLRLIDGKVKLQACNDSPNIISTKAKIGYISLDGRLSELKEISIDITARSRAYVYSCELPANDYKKGHFVVIPESGFEPAILRQYDYKELNTVKSDISVKKCVQQGVDVEVTVESSVYSHLAAVEGDYKCSDNYFDLLPNQSKTIVVYNAKTEDVKLSAYN